MILYKLCTETEDLLASDEEDQTHVFFDELEIDNSNPVLAKDVEKCSNHEDLHTDAIHSIENEVIENVVSNEYNLTVFFVQAFSTKCENLVGLSNMPEQQDDCSVPKSTILDSTIASCKKKYGYISPSTNCYHGRAPVSIVKLTKLLSDWAKQKHIAPSWSFHSALCRTNFFSFWCLYLQIPWLPFY